MKIKRDFSNKVMLLTFLFLFIPGAYASADAQKTKQPKEMPDAPKIISFTVSPQRIDPGATGTLQWSTANTDNVVISERNQKKLLLVQNAPETSGSLQISPTQTATYRILARKGSRSVSRDVTIQVTKQSAPTATCSITGQISGKLDWDLTDLRGEPLRLKVTEIYMEIPGETTNWIRARLQGRTYEFKNVPAGKTYRIFPNTTRKEPYERVVVCEPNQTHTGMDFEITGPPMHD
ncbi:MAG: hypothetical protein OEU68_00935 [Nitrospira sp.]|nr:hypothetical protein [Nitrospira sp.]MDH4244983.1 hypothetical protein [Nitrospira sp.]MDH4354457.1 hypothetical protein [Nitrospira sp.]MDH5319230.1 hypothetical protein [Nitrospira sp.]